MRIGFPSDDERFSYLRTFVSSVMHVKYDYYTHRHAIPKRDDLLLGLLREWASDLDVIFLPLTFAHFGSLRIAELVHLHDVDLGLALYSASYQLSHRLAVPLFDAYLDARQLEPEMKKYVSGDGGIYGSAFDDKDGCVAVARSIQAIIESATSDSRTRIQKQSALEIYISALLTTQGCFTFDPYSGRHPELALRAGILDYKSRLYLEDQIRQFPRGAIQQEVDDWKSSQLTIIGNVTMTQDRIQISNVAGPVNVRSRLDHVAQIIAHSSGDERRKNDLTQLIQELTTAIEQVPRDGSDDAVRVVEAAEMVVKEAGKQKPNRSFLKISADGLIEAAKAVAAIAPGVLDVASRIARFVVDGR